MSVDPPLTQVLTRADIQALMTMPDYIDAVERAFVNMAAGQMVSAAVVHMGMPEGGFHIKSAYTTQAPRFAVTKINANFPLNAARHGLPTIQGALVLCSGEDGRLLAIMDSMEVTTMRTAAATAVAARHLARPSSRVAAVLGCGKLGAAQIPALRAVLPLEEFRLFDSDATRAKALAETYPSKDEFRLLAHPELAGCLEDVDVIVTCTTAQQAILTPALVPPGCFIAAVGADNAAKQELSAELVAGARVITDLTVQCADIGELHHAMAAGLMHSGDVVAELGDWIRLEQKPDFAAQDIVIFDSTGTASQDLAAAMMIYARAQINDVRTAVQFG